MPVRLAVDAGKPVARGMGGETSAAALDIGQGLLEALQAARDDLFLGFKPRIIKDKLRRFAHPAIMD